MKTLDFRGFPVDSNIHLESKMNMLTKNGTSLVYPNFQTQPYFP